ncbi:class I SAM-dependent methyltransferase [Puia sp. P3]|uniref:class I SAM-dependent methyltransferase n=1 Tax=Puia sp. P3 TaxID=3423952 RepID=UPI003D66A60F
MENQPSEKINSIRYWDQRFFADWKEQNGVEQSQFFARLAVDNFPGWFARYIQLNQPSFCDWGCAMGNGTMVLHDLLSLENITGIDFSTVAIKQARSSYPAVSFIAADILQDGNFPQFDVLFSSNTLEHFENPWRSSEKLSFFAKKFIVLLIPFQEFDRHTEHFYTFEPANIPSTIRASYYLTHFSVVDATEYSPNYWYGHQILLIYSTQPELASLGLTLAGANDKSNSSQY